MANSYTLFGAKGSLSLYETSFCLIMTLDRVILLLIIAVMSSAHVHIIGWSSFSVSHALDALVISSATSINNIGEQIPPYCSPFSRWMVGDSSHILSFGYVSTSFTSSSVPLLNAFILSSLALWLYFLFSFPVIGSISGMIFSLQFFIT